MLFRNPNCFGARPPLLTRAPIIYFYSSCVFYSSCGNFLGLGAISSLASFQISGTCAVGEENWRLPRQFLSSQLKSSRWSLPGLQLYLARFCLSRSAVHSLRTAGQVFWLLFRIWPRAGPIINNNDSSKFVTSLGNRRPGLLVAIFIGQARWFLSTSWHISFYNL